MMTMDVRAADLVREDNLAHGAVMAQVPSRQQVCAEITVIPTRMCQPLE